jgi:hypothetical protein
MKKAFLGGLVIVLILLVSMVPLVSAQAIEPIGEGASCGEMPVAEPNTFRKGLKTFNENQNTGRICAPIAAGISQHWFQEKCGLEYKAKYTAEEFISKLNYFFFTDAGEGAQLGDIVLGTRRFLEEEGVSNCFNITLKICPDMTVGYSRLLYSSNVDGDVVALEELFPDADVLHANDRILSECPTQELIEKELSKSADIILGYIAPGFAHVVAVDGSDSSGINVNSNGLPARLIGPSLNEFETGDAKRKYDRAGISDGYEEERAKVVGKEAYWVDESISFLYQVYLAHLISITPSGNCNMDCPKVDYVEGKADSPAVSLDSSIDAVIAYTANGNPYDALLNTDDNILTVALEDKDYLYMTVNVHADTESYLYAGDQVVGPFTGEKEITIGYAESFQLVSKGEVGGVKGDVYSIGEPGLGGFNFGFDVGRLSSQLWLGEFSGKYSATDLGGFPLSSALKGSYMATKKALGNLFD